MSGAIAVGMIERAVSIGPSASAEEASSLEAVRAWSRWIDHALVEWGRCTLHDIGITPPTRAVIGWAIQVANDLCVQGQPAPTRVVPNGDGGIVFERRVGTVSESLEVEDDGAIYYSAFVRSRLTTRQFLGRMRD